MISVEPGQKGRAEQGEREEERAEEREGKYSISIKIRNEEIQQSPIKFEMRSISSENTFAMINGKEIHEKPKSPIVIEPTKPFEFEMISVDQFGSKMEKGGAIFDHSFEPPFPHAQVNFSLLFPFFLSHSHFQSNNKMIMCFYPLKLK